MKLTIVVALLITLVWTSSVFAGDETVLAKVGDTKITMADFNRIISFYDEEKQKALEQNPAFKATILQRIVQGMVIAKVAREKGFADRPDVKEQIRLMTNDLLASEYLKKEVVDSIKVTDEDLQLYYKGHKEEFGTPEMVRARHIFFKVTKSMTDEEKDKLKEKAETVLKRIKAGEDFAKLAEEFSDDDGSKTKGGDLGFFTKGKMVPEFENTAFALKAGEVSDVIQSPYGYHIIKVEEKKEATLQPFDKVKEKVREKVFEEFKKAKAQEFVNSAMEKAGVQLNLDVFLPKQ